MGISSAANGKSNSTSVVRNPVTSSPTARRLASISPALAQAF
jgi:hypothetical protein